MNNTITRTLALTSGIAAILSVQAAEAVSLVAPTNGATVYMPHPHFQWERSVGDKLERAFQIQIGTEDGKLIVDETLAVVSRHVCSKSLPPGKYRWRVRQAGRTRWSEALRFEIAEPNTFRVANGANSEEIEAVIHEAAKNTPAKVLFEPGEYRIEKRINFRETTDLTLDGGGSTFLLDDTFLGFTFCANITLQNMILKPTVDPGTHLDILAVDAENRTVTVRAQEGFPQDLHRVFTPGKGAGLMRCIDKANPGKVVRFAMISMSDPGISLAGPDEEGRYTFHNVKTTTFKGIRPGMTGALLKYSYGAFIPQFTRKVTLSNTTLLGLGGATIHGTDNSALSILSCRFLPLTPDHYLGAQGFISGGITGMWVEGCEFTHAPDDNMAVQTLKVPLEEIDRNGIAVLKKHPWISEIRAGDEVLLWCVASNTTAVVDVLDTRDKNGLPVPTGDLEDRRPKKLRLAKGAEQLNADLGRPADASFADVLLFRYSPNNEDFVFRNNQILGGSAGCMYNGMRGLIEGNTFKNCRGPGIRPGYHSPNEASGYGARDVLVQNNVMENCGSFGVVTRSTANVGGNIIIKDNVIKNSDIDNGLFWGSVFVKNHMDNIVVKDNLFESTVAPERGAWILSESNPSGVEHSGNTTKSPFPISSIKEKR